VLIAGTSLGWNIYRDLVLRARLQVSCNISSIFSGQQRSGPYIALKVANKGPGPIFCNTVYIRETSFLLWLCRKRKNASFVHDYTNPLCSKLPLKLEVGDSATYLFNPTPDCFLSESYNQIGMSDSYGHVHWAPKADIARTRIEFNKLRRPA